MTNAVNIAQSGTNNVSWRNRIINGGMVIDQRNAGASVTPTTSTYTVDRWQYQCSVASKMSVQQNAGAVTPPVGFSNYLGFTTVSAYTAAAGEVFEVAHKVEGFNFADMGWGTANASTVTLSFWVRSSVTGTHSGSFTNNAGNRSYPFTFTISSANTWEYETVTIAGDTSGTWIGATNGTGVVLYFDFGSGSTYRGTAGAWASANYVGATGAVSVVGTGSATFYITGVQLEAGSVASPFERRDYGRELMMCQRYYSKSYDIGTAVGTNTSYYQSEVATQTVTSGGLCQTSKLRFPVVMRVAPTVNLWTYSGTAGSWHAGVAGQSETAYSASANAGFAGTTGVVISMSGVNTTYNTAYGHWAASAEL